MTARKVLLIGWDAADWEHITPLLEEGLMPTLDAFINRGVMGNLATLQPILSPMLWNSVATGKFADKHGIHGFIEPDLVNGVARPYSSTSRKCKAFWCPGLASATKSSPDVGMVIESVLPPGTFGRPTGRRVLAAGQTSAPPRRDAHAHGSKEIASQPIRTKHDGRLTKARCNTGGNWGADG